MTPPALELQDLTVSFPAGRTRREVVRSVDLDLPAGRTLGVVGESGSGKSMILRAVMGLLPGSARVESGSLHLGGAAVPLAGRRMRAARRRRLAMVFQDPGAALDPLMTIGDQIAEVPRRVFGETRQASRTIALDLLRSVAVPDPERQASSYPHQLSGGQRQRAVIAAALACRPEVLLCDEPTTALDVTVQAGILDLLRRLRDESALSMVFVSHDLAVVGSMADRIQVLRAGSTVEDGPADRVLSRPREAYTGNLLAAVLDLPPAAAASAPAATDRTAPAPAAPDRAAPDRAAPVPAAPDHRVLTAAPPDVRQGLCAKGITLTYGTGESAVTALRGVDVEAPSGRIVGLVGESGSGKTTLAKVLTGQLRPDGGAVVVDGVTMPGRRSAAQRSAVQMVYQDPYSSLDPRMTVRQTLAELLLLVRRVPRREVDGRCRELLSQVSMPASSLDGYPGQFSGGQRQRIAIARALAVDPVVLVADEPTSALDVAVQQEILDLLRRLRDDLDLSLVVISHNLAVIRHLCDDVAVLRDGAVVEAGPAAQVIDFPQHPYTRALVAAVPRLPKDTP